MNADLRERAFWVFDMDGTLTIPAHDFEAFKVEHGLPADRDLLSAAEDLGEPRRTEILDAVERKLERERTTADSLKIRVDELTRERLTLKERVELLLVEKTSLERSRTNLTTELDSVAKAKEVLNEAFEKNSREIQLLRNENEHLQKLNAQYTKDIREKQTLIGKLEWVRGLGTFVLSLLLNILLSFLRLEVQ